MPIIRVLLLLLPAMLLLASPAGAHTLESLEDGAWESIAWYPGGAPTAVDTVVIIHDVGAMPSRSFGVVIVRRGGRLAVGAETPTVAGLINRGTLRIDAPGSLRVDGDALNDGTILGEGTLQMSRNGGTIAGPRPWHHLLIGGAEGTTVHLVGDVVASSLWLADENRLDAGGFDLTLNGPYNSNSLYGRPGIIGGEGVIHLNGDLHGSVSGKIRLGIPAGVTRSRYASPPSVYGVLGDPSGSVTITEGRHLRNAVLMGVVTVDSGVTAEADGIGPDGRVRVFGTLVNHGTLTAVESQHRWTVDSVLESTGRVERCSVEMTGYRPTLTTTSAGWDGSAGLIYTAPAGGRLDVNGVEVLSTLTIVPHQVGDSDIVVMLNGGSLRIRHNFTSTISAGCRLRSDTLVRIWGRAHGDIEAPVRFEGFRGAAVGGRFGRDSGEVVVLQPRLIDGGFVARGGLATHSAAELRVDAVAHVGGDAVIGGLLTLDTGSVLSVGGSVDLQRRVDGAGTIALVDSTSTLTVRDTLAGAVGIAIGDGIGSSSVTLGGTLRVPRLRIHAASRLYHNNSQYVTVSDLFCYDILMSAGYSMSSPAAEPYTPHVDSIYSGRTSDVFRFQGEYVATTTTLSGEGYYVRYDEPTVISWRGGFLDPPMTIPLIAGWNLIGAAGIPVNVEDITVTATTLTSGFSLVQGSTTTVSVLLPGESYWVQTSGEGSLTLNAPPAAAVGRVRETVKRRSAVNELQRR